MECVPERTAGLCDAVRIPGTGASSGRSTRDDSTCVPGRCAGARTAAVNGVSMRLGSPCFGVHPQQTEVDMYIGGGALLLIVLLVLFFL